MSKIGTWVLQLQEDAANMTRHDFIKKHGTSQVDVWDNQDDDTKEMVNNFDKAQKIENELKPSIETMEIELHNGTYYGDVAKAIKEITNSMIKMANVLDQVNKRLIKVEQEQNNPTRPLDIFKNNIESTINLMSKSELAEVGLSKKKDS